MIGPISIERLLGDAFWKPTMPARAPEEDSEDGGCVLSMTA